MSQLPFEKNPLITNRYLVVISILNSSALQAICRKKTAFQFSSVLLDKIKNDDHGLITLENEDGIFLLVRVPQILGISIKSLRK